MLSFLLICHLYDFLCCIKLAFHLSHMYYYGVNMVTDLSFLYMIIGCNNETCSPSKCGSFHGCSHKASASVNSDRISAKVIFFVFMYCSLPLVRTW